MQKPRMFPPFHSVLKSFALALLPGVAGALEIRQYSPSRHDRFTTGGFNNAAYYNPLLYTAVGYATNPADPRQFALVTPQHVLFARHVSYGGVMRFMNSEGNTFDRAIASTIDVPNENGGISDLIIMKISAPVGETEKITPLPYLNLNSENSYNGMVFVTFGQDNRAGRGVLNGGFSNFSQTGPPEIGSTRVFTFQHSTFSGNRDDAVAVVGDSGSPTFAIADGRPALVGVHLAASRGTFTNITSDTFVPHYAETVNGLLAPEGYQLIPAYPEAVTLSSTATHAPLLQASSGDVTFGLSNSDPDTATNVRLDLDFPADAIPTSVSAPGWIIENTSSGSYRLRTATLAGNSSTTVTAAYSAIPTVAEISVAATYRSDGSSLTDRTFNLPVQMTFAGFVSDLPLKGRTDDPDSDGFGNLLEYAFGGDPGTNSASGTGGQSLAPVHSSETDSFSLTFPRRTDAAGRNLSYGIEFSETLMEGSWSATPPPGFTISATPYSPDIHGFEQVTASIPIDGGEKFFARVAVTLDE